MNMDKERKAFEEWLKETNKTLYNFSQEFIDDDSTESLCLQWAWTAWNASLNREGCKLVPVDKVVDCLNQIGDKSYIDDNVSELKAMIGVIK